MERDLPPGKYEALITFSGNPLDRVNHRRKDEDFLSSQRSHPDSLCIPFRRLLPLLSCCPDRAVRWKALHEIIKLAGEDIELVLLGIRNGVAHYAAELSEENAKALLSQSADNASEFADLRRVSAFLPHEDASILAQARALLEWHAKRKYCGMCASPMYPIEGGSKRQCTNKTGTGCRNREYPRINPVVIMLVIHPDGKHCLLGTQNRLSGITNFWSCLAGFMDTGETIEEAVRREVWEESGVKVGEVTYFATQPWPFGMELMIGCFAHALTKEINIDHKEIADARWFTREEIEKGVNTAATDPERTWRSSEWRVPAKTAIAHQLMAAWLYSLRD